MSVDSKHGLEERKITMKDLKADADPRWCTGCGDYTILVGLRKFMVNNQILPEDTVNVSGIGCSGRIPHYMDTYGLHAVHGRAIPVATGLKLARPDLDVFIHSGDGDALSIGGNHLIHGIKNNVNCVFLMFDNQIYGLTKNQTSPTSKKGLPTMTQPEGSQLDPINPIQFVLGLNCSFVASTAEWMGKHLVETIDLAFKHKGFSFVHIAQRCPKFNPKAWNFQSSEWVTFLEGAGGVTPDLKAAPDAQIKEHNASSFGDAMSAAMTGIASTFGVFYQSIDRVIYDDVQNQTLENTPQKDPKTLLDGFVI